MSDSNQALQSLQASVDSLKQAVDANASRQAADTAVLFTVVSLMLADTRNLIEDSCGPMVCRMRHCRPT